MTTQLDRNASTADAIRWGAERLGIDPQVLATVISYESAGTFSTSIKGPRTHRGQHIGLIQFGDEEQKKYGASPDQTVAEQMQAVVGYMSDRGVKPGMALLDVYSTVNAGAPGRYSASDAHVGGAPGNVRDKVQSRMMADHARKAAQLLGGELTDEQLTSLQSGGGARPAPTGVDAVASLWDTSAQSLREEMRSNMDTSMDALRQSESPLEKVRRKFKTNEFDGATEWAAAVNVAAGNDPTEVLAGNREAIAQAVAESGARSQGEAVTRDDRVQFAAEQEARNQAQQDSSMGDKFSYLWREGSVTGALVDWIDNLNPGSTGRDPTFNYTEHMAELEAGRSMVEVEELRAASMTNRENLDHIRATQDKKREDAKVMRYAGAGESFLLSTGASLLDPAGMLAGFGVMKGMHALGVGSRAAMMAGNTGRAFLYAGAEGAIGNVGATAMMDGLGARVTASDYLTAAAAGWVMGTPFAALDMKDAKVYAAQQELIRIGRQLADDAATRTARFNEAAVAELGEGATPEQINARAAELEAAELRSNAEALVNDTDLTLQARDSEEVEAPVTAEAPAEPDMRVTENGTDVPAPWIQDEDGTWIRNPAAEQEPARVDTRARNTAQTDDDFNTWERDGAEFEAATDELDGIRAGRPLPAQDEATLRALLGDDFDDSVYRGSPMWRTPRKFDDGMGNDTRIADLANDLAARGESPAALLRTVADFDTLRADQRLLAAKLADMMDAAGTKLVDTAQAEAWFGDLSGVGGLYFPRDNRLYIRAATPEVVIHEALHAVTARAMHATVGPGATLRRGLSTILADVRAQLEKIGRQSNTWSSDERARMASQAMGDRVYGASSFLDNEDELLAYGLTNPHVQAILRRLPSPGNTVSPQAKKHSAWDWFKNAVREVLGLSPAFRSVLDDLLDVSSAGLDNIARAGGVAPVSPTARRTGTLEGLPSTMPGNVDEAVQVIPGKKDALIKTRAQLNAVVTKYGLDTSISDNVERALAAEMYARAEQALTKLNIDEARLRPLLSQVGWEATSTRMLLSKNPLMKATAALLLENPEGAAGRRPSAALLAKMGFRRYMGVMEPHYESLMTVWAQGKGHGALRRHVDPKVKEQFDRAVQEEMHARWSGGTSTTDPSIIRMADILDDGFKRMGAEFQASGAIGGKRIPVGQSGYLPRIMDGGRVASLTTEQRAVVHGMLAEDLQTTAGFDKAFSQKLATKMLETAIDKATKGWMTSLDLRSADTADTLLDSLRALGMGASEIQKVLGRYSRGGASFTKSRLDLDLQKSHTMPDGSVFKLADIYSHDILSLYKGYAQRVAGEVALTRFGIQGAPGVKELRVALRSAGSEYGATPAELEAFDQAMAEITGTPIGTKTGKWGDNTRSLVSSTFLGGMGWTQLAESGNGLHAIGAWGVLNATLGGRRLLSEVRKLGKGEAVNNPILQSLEEFTGAIGADGYRVLGLREVGDRMPTYGHEDIGMGSLAVRGVGHAVRVLSMQRAIEAVQIRGMSEQIVMKMMRFIRDGGEDLALRDMGLSPELEATLRAELPNIAQWDGSGKLTSLDLTKMADRRAAWELATVVERGSSQIIQRTYAGEVGKWAHNDYLLLLAQFRTYPLTATQKQWRRVAFSQGVGKAIGYIIGAASIATPIYMARMAAQSLGREEGWLEEQVTDPMKLGIAAARYTSGLGLTSDVLEAGMAAAGMEGQGPRGAGPAGAVPVVGLAQKYGKALSWSGDPAKDIKEVATALPGSSVPVVKAGLDELFAE